MDKKTSSAVFFPFAKRQDRLCIINLKSCIYKDTSCNKSLLIFKRSEKVIQNALFVDILGFSEISASEKKKFWCLMIFNLCVFYTGFRVGCNFFMQVKQFTWVYLCSKWVYLRHFHSSKFQMFLSYSKTYNLCIFFAGDEISYVIFT